MEEQKEGKLILLLSKKNESKTAPIPVLVRTTKTYIKLYEQYLSFETTL